MIWECAGIVGINPGPFTLRELIFMAEGRQKSEWNRVSLIAALLANPNRDTKKRSEPYTPDDFNPYAEKKPIKHLKPSEFAAMFLKAN